jgi:glycosyltransferase involved in cell wall biosynthesis
MDPKFGGTAEAVRMLLRYAPSGVASELMTLDDPQAPFLHELGCTVYALGPVGSTYGYSPQLIPWLEANRDRFDGVVVHGLWQYCTNAVHKAMHGHVPYMVFPHGMLDPYFKRRFPLKHLKKWIYWLGVEYWALRDAERVLFTTASEQELASQSFWLHRWKGQAVPFGTVPPEGDPEQQCKAFYAACPRARGRRLLLFLGRIHAKKGCDMLVDAFLRAAAQDPELELVMAGPDQQNSRAGLEQRARAAGMEARIHWPGMLLGDSKWGAFRASEAFILPSHQENFGIAVAEALACGRPVLLSDKVNIAKDIASDGAGLIEPDTSKGTARLLKRWIEMPLADRAIMGERALDCFHRRYDMRNGAKAVVELFEQLRIRSC